MRSNIMKGALALAAALQIAGCPGGGGGETESDGTTDTPTSGDDPTGTASTLCERMGGAAGVGEMIGIFVGKVVADERINAYFLSTDVDGGNLSKCLTEQVGAAVECPGVTYTCGDMVTVHKGMGISMSDFGDLAEDFVAAWDEYKAAKAPDLTQEDKDAVVGVLSGMAPDIVEDAPGTATIYQRVGRRPAIKALIGDPGAADSFVGVVAADAAINTFFADSDFERLNTCLTRQVTGATGGPNHYGKEVDAPVDPGVGAAKPCLDMIASHKDLKDADGEGITVDDFLALAMDLGTAMTNFSVTEADQMSIVNALVPLCPDIVTVDPENCP